MKEKLNMVLLIDDDEPTNFLHEITITEAEVAEKVVAVESGLEALNFLTTSVDGKLPKPDLIFLDINMPGMNGWEFLEEYNALAPEVQGKIIVVMLTTSLNPDDEQRANGLSPICGFLKKPLTAKMLNRVLKEHFPDQL